MVMVALQRSRSIHDDLRCKSLGQAMDWLLDGVAIIRGDGSLVYANNLVLGNRRGPKRLLPSERQN
jgi:hypothetical protein